MLSALNIEFTFVVFTEMLPIEKDRLFVLVELLFAGTICSVVPDKLELLAETVSVNRLSLVIEVFNLFSCVTSYIPPPCSPSQKSCVSQ